MYSTPLTWAAAAAALLGAASLSSASPAPIPGPHVVVARPQNDLGFREALELAHQPHLDRRLEAEFSMAKSWENEVLFAGSWVSSDAATGITDTVSLAVTCLDCWTKGSIKASLTDEDIIDPTVRLDFTGVEAYADLEVDISTGATYAVNLFTSDSPLSLGFPGLSVGVVFYVDLVFSLTEEIDLEGGFYVKLADDAFLEASVFGGDIVNSFFDGLSSKSLPITVKSGKATFKADLRLRVQCGAEADVLGIGAGAELGIYANLIEFVAVLEETADCALQSMESWDLNVGAYAHLDVVIDYKTLGAIPTVSTTLLTAPTLTQCWIEGGSGGYGATITATTAPVGVSTGSPSESGSGGVGGPNVGGSGSATLSTIVMSSPVITTAPSATISASGTGSGYPYGNSSASASGSGSGSGGDEIVTSTVYTTTVYTITSCAASVPNCPASMQSQIVVTRTVDLYTTVCPAMAVITGPASSSTTTTSTRATGTFAHAAATTTLITDVVVLVPCATPVVETFVPSAPSSTGTTSVAVQNSASASSATPATKSTSAPFVGGNGGKVVQWNNGTSSAAISVYSTGATKPSASFTSSGPTTTAPPVQTAGAAGRAGAVASGLMIVAAFVCMVL
ncbi:hypothetical protein QBC46DRAFT_390074 [Diplogelasinospora grovesii]|uniref:Uncharacterized protein n=1 Tax=Diplogelasinospora grovesii TaxID=303347 RepID=A0AAN6S3I4_9PEZI|nr:hypothetical protein QBC46DRAFT_390074 [Diplogelasinospora grovesii]